MRLGHFLFKDRSVKIGMTQKQMATMMWMSKRGKTDESGPRTSGVTNADECGVRGVTKGD